jgi:photosystem II stability/assembly factor-like uncharacterized protein
MCSGRPGGAGEVSPTLSSVPACAASRRGRTVPYWVNTRGLLCVGFHGSGLPTSRGRRATRARWLLLALVIAALVTSCGHPGRQGLQRPGPHRQTPAWWAFQYVHFVSPSDGWALAEKATQNGLTELLTSHDGGWHWRDVTPPVVLAGENAGVDKPGAASPDLLTPFILNSRDAWLPVVRSHGRSSELDVLMTSDAGRRWVLRGRFPGTDLAGIFFLSPSAGFIETDISGAMGGGQGHVYATSDGGKHWRAVSVINVDSRFCVDYGSLDDGVSFASPRVGFLTWLCVDGSIGLERTSDGGRKWHYTQIAPYDGDHAVASSAPVFSSPKVGSMVAEMLPVLRFAATTDAGRHWDLLHLPPAAVRAIRSGNYFCPEFAGCLDVVSARTWVVGAGHELYTTTDAGRSWMVSPSRMALTNLELDFLGPRVGWAWERDGPALLWRTTDGGRQWSTFSLGRSS